MNKQELIGSVADAAGLSRVDAGKAVEAVFESITKASTGRNPRTGETMKIAASVQPKFKAGKGLKDAVN